MSKLSSSYSALRASDDYASLMAVSERLGGNPHQVQGPGGNTSIKQDGAMWVKASGTWLRDASTQEIMVPVNAAALAAGLDGETPDTAFVAHDENPAGLRPSIETSFHAAIDWPVVLHTHCVSTIATAIRRDAAEVVDERLSRFDAVFIPYHKPGRDLTRAILAATHSNNKVFILGNHGLICCGKTVLEAEELLVAVSSRLERPPRALPAADPTLGDELVGSGWRLAPEQTHGLACDSALLELAAGRSLYPDHVVFLGPGVTVVPEGVSVATACEALGVPGPASKLLLFAGRGAAVPDDASAAVLAMARALSDVLTRVPPKAELVRLAEDQERDLLNWDAEKYRKTLGGAHE